MTYYYCTHGTIRSIEFEADFASAGADGERIDKEPTDYRDIYIKNGDGIDLRCGCSDILIENITGQTEDDSVALTALKGRSETRFFVPEKGWDIHHIVVKNVMTRVRSGAQLRLLCADGTRVHDVCADTLVDTSPAQAWQTSVFLGYAILAEYIRERTSVRGEMTNISISNVFSNSYRAILAGCALENLRITNLYCRSGVRHAVTTENIAELHACMIDGVFCEAGACPEAIFSFRGETQGALQIRNIHALETKCVVRSEGALNVELENCRVEKITGAL